MEKETKVTTQYKFVKQALIMAMFTASLMAIYEFAASALHFEMGMSIFDMSQYATNRSVPYNWALIICLTVSFPMVYLLYKEKGISFKEAIYQPKTLVRDVAIGILGAVISTVLNGVWHFAIASQVKVPANLPEVPFNGYNFALQIISLVFFSAFVKELIFRGFAMHMGAEVFGEFPSFLLFNLIFSVLDWMNFGSSFVGGCIWYLCYKKTRKLITPIVCHGVANLLGVVIGVFVLHM